MNPDVIVVGSGMSGAPAAWMLSERGHNVLLIESGTDISPADLPTASVNWERKRDSEFTPVAANRNNVGDYPVDDKESQVAVCNYNAVGGSSILYSAHFPRFLRSDFKLKSEQGLAADWPISYDELLPFFDLNEQTVGVAGKVGDSFYPEITTVSSAPVPLGIAGKRLADGFEKVGWHCWPSYAAINIDRNISHRLKCHGLGPCNTGCPMGAKATTVNTYLSMGLANRVTLMSELVVARLLVRDSQVVGVEVIDREKKVSQIHCNNVVLAAGAIGTPRILLNTIQQSDQKLDIPRADLIGKNLMMHPLGYAQGYFSEKIDSEKGPQGAMLYSLEFYRQSEPVDFQLGFMMHALRGDAPVDTMKGLYSRRKLKFGSEIYRQFSENYGHSIGVAIICEDLPDLDNKVELDNDNADYYGVPGVKVTYKLSNNTKRMMSYGLKKARQVLSVAGAKKTSGFGPIRNTGWHLFGTTCMGENPNEAVVGACGQVYGLKGAYVFDASIFVTSSCVNPANTIQAVSLYLSDKLDKCIKDES